MDGQKTWMPAFHTSSLVLYLARVQSVPHLIMDCDVGLKVKRLVGLKVSWECLVMYELVFGVWCLIIPDICHFLYATAFFGM